MSGYHSQRAWDIRFLKLACTISDWSKDPSTKVGAVIADQNNRLVSVGFNGFPQSIADDPERLENRSLKYEMTIHAEINAILFAQRNLYGCSLYTYPFAPCSRCAAICIQSGLKRIISLNCSCKRWEDTLQHGESLFQEAGLAYLLYPEDEINDGGSDQSNSLSEAIPLSTDYFNPEEQVVGSD